MAKRRNHPNSADDGGKAWAGRFRAKTDRFVEAFTRSVTVDSRLYAEDIVGSIAHCKTLEKARVLTRAETRTIVAWAGISEARVGPWEIRLFTSR